MKRIGILGDIGSGKSYVAKKFGYPVFDADKEVSNLYKKDKKVFSKLKKILPKYFNEFPINKRDVVTAILDKELNLKKLLKLFIMKLEKIENFLKHNRGKKFVIFDIPLLLENKINKKGDILIYIDSRKNAVFKRLKKEEILIINYLENLKMFNYHLIIRRKNLNLL